MSPATQVRETDRMFDYEGGVRIVIDPESFSFMQGSAIDFISDSLGGDFHISNPNAVWTFGCGKSFRTAVSSHEAHATGECGCG
jgi:iron-sulfur cluster assembly protein